ncbi:uncharacterized protein F4822DRAFT_284597 [Hypoxylon trugodes]|uniref:uncharacterized protein n=1 Tax=Hypoxylon trugodes TaxID=326681 RepID=UPI00218F6DBE|nr:uncharacterized protein F4822DRAFT_284597 [Hypoxylon trugodes]KAI1387501.1 hypothetical protein F4822DRAFT_284597 [Hypoxylon trugodes]
MASIQELLSPTANGQKSTVPEVRGRNGSPRVDNPGETTHFTVEIILDVICPYCYVNCKNLNTAVRTYTARHPEATFMVTCSPYLLDPIAGRSAYNKSDYPTIRAHSRDYWLALGEPVGVTFKFEGRMGNTRDAHKLLRFALESEPSTTPSTAFAARISNQNQRAAPALALPPRGASASTGIAENGGSESANTSHPRTRGPTLQLRVLEALFRGHHEEGGDISDREYLIQTGVAAMAGTGIGEAEIRGMLEESDSPSPSPSPNNDTAMEDANQDQNREGENEETNTRPRTWGRAVDTLFADITSPSGGRGLAVRAVPTLIVNDRYVIGGAQGVAFLVAEFERIRRGGVRDSETYYT